MGYYLKKWQDLQLQDGVLKNLKCTLIFEYRIFKSIFLFKIHFAAEIPLTKRTLVSQIARMFDPLGWLSPITMSIKDDANGVFIKNWIKIKIHLPAVENIRISKYEFHLCLNITYYEIHLFRDASTTGYVAMITYNLQERR